MELTPRQGEILSIVENNAPISGDLVALNLGLTRATLRSDLALLTMLGLLEAKPKVGYSLSKKASTPLLYDDLFGRKVMDIMKPPCFINQNTTVQDAISDMFLHDIGSLYVLDEKKALAGIVSRKDLLRVSMSGGQHIAYPVAMIMTRMPNLVTSFPQDTILDAAYKMMSREIDSLPVVDSQNPTTVVGRISKTIITHFFTEEGMRRSI